MDSWKDAFVQKMSQVHSRWARAFDEAVEEHVQPVFDEIASFLDQNGFSSSTPMRESGRRSFKFELAEDAYVLLIFRSTAVGEFELTSQWFALGQEPRIRKNTERINSIDRNWARQKIQSAMDVFIEMLGGIVEAPEPALAIV